MTKFKNSKFDKTQKHTLWSNSKTQSVTKLKNSKCYKISKLKMWQNKKKIGQNSKLKMPKKNKKKSICKKYQKT